MKLTKQHLKQIIKEELQNEVGVVTEVAPQEDKDSPEVQKNILLN